MTRYYFTLSRSELRQIYKETSQLIVFLLNTLFLRRSLKNRVEFICLCICCGFLDISWCAFNDATIFKVAAFNVGLFDAILFHVALCYYDIIWCCSIFIFDYSIFLFCQGFLSQTLTTHRIAEQRRGPSFIPLYHFHSLTNIQKLIYNSFAPICMWDVYHIFLIATVVFTGLLLDGIYQLIELLFEWLMMWYWFLLTCLLNWFYSGFFIAIWLEKLASTVILVLQALLLHNCCAALLLYDCCTILMFHYLMLH